MKNRIIYAKNNTITICFILSVYLLIVATPGHTQGDKTHGVDTDLVFWKSLSFETKNFFVTLNTNIHFEIFTAEKIKTSLIQTPEGTALQASGPKIFVITVESVIDPLMGSTEYIQSKAWCDPINMAALQRIRLRQGEKDWQKTYRFTCKGVFRRKKETTPSAKTNLSVKRQTDISESFYPYDFKKTECLYVLEPSEMFIIASLFAGSLESESLNLCVFSKKQAYHIDVHASELKRLKVDYIEKSTKNEVRRNGYIDSIKISFKIRPSAKKNQQNNEFSFLGLKGDFDIYIDEASRIPILVSGQIPMFGKVDLSLDTVVLRSHQIRCGAL